MVKLVLSPVLSTDIILCEYILNIYIYNVFIKFIMKKRLILLSFFELSHQVINNFQQIEIDLVQKRNWFLFKKKKEIGLVHSEYVIDIYFLKFITVFFFDHMSFPISKDDFICRP